ncbi:hypothetical protein BCR33DRAFT_738773 [Rhizoclosmatium globosum]|uniref:Uncharacterized protein n=1 Tax=Rhizoclosmatium globosum TaxID=329046 RepID=A0A1Y2C7J8_9FUNG|nr:hypothetical protein BCR33DRAFT_738773 [Rhizoclosmatium globosum]|eukprot:ORY42999.1 hypothetical protein BCR33DRAFT_738773 [Rhizoclosmatium globosum]
MLLQQLLVGLTACALTGSAIPLERGRGTRKVPDETPHNFTHTSPIHFEYHGGRLLTNPEVTPVYYNVTKELQDDLNKFYAALVSSSYMNIFAEYNTPTQTIGKGSVLPPVIWSKEIVPSLEDDNDIRELFRQMIRDGTISPNEQSYYPMHVSPYTKTICGTEVGAYHGCVYTADISDLDCVPYGLIPSCLYDEFPNMAESVSVGASHEFAESITDRDPDTGWITTIDGLPGQELSDYCGNDDDPYQKEFHYSTIVDAKGQKFTVQGQWSGADQRCIIDFPKNPVTRRPVLKQKDDVFAKFASGDPLSSIEITPVFYGPNVNYSAEMADYYNFIASSKYLDTLAEYSSTPMGRGKSLPPRYDFGTNFASSSMKITVDVDDGVKSYLT